MALNKIEFNSVTEGRLVEELEKEFPDASGMEIDLLEFDFHSCDNSYLVHFSYECYTSFEGFKLRTGKFWFTARISDSGKVEDFSWL